MLVDLCHSLQVLPGDVLDASLDDVEASTHVLLELIAPAFEHTSSRACAATGVATCAASSISPPRNCGGEVVACEAKAEDAIGDMLARGSEIKVRPSGHNERNPNSRKGLAAQGIAESRLPVCKPASSGAGRDQRPAEALIPNGLEPIGI